MAMHLERIRIIERSKSKKSNRKSLQQAKQEHAKYLESMGLGNVASRADKRRKRPIQHEAYVRSGVQTSDNICATSGKREQVYTGTLIKGISTMHKSNSVPVINKEQAIEISQMRRN